MRSFIVLPVPDFLSGFAGVETILPGFSSDANERHAPHSKVMGVPRRFDPAEP
jgi:hypothetical protein